MSNEERAKQAIEYLRSRGRYVGDPGNKSKVDLAKTDVAKTIDKERKRLKKEAEEKPEPRTAPVFLLKRGQL